MRKQQGSLGSTAALMVSLGCFVAIGGGRCVAQQSLSGSLSGSIGDTYSSSTSTDGFNTSIDPTAGNLTQENPNGGVSDDTHSQLLGSAISPFDNADAFSYTDTAPHTSIVSDSQSIIGSSPFSYGGRRNVSFSGASANVPGLAGRIAALGASGSISMQSAFSNGISGRSAFTTQGSASPAGTMIGFSGEGVAPIRATSGIGITQTLTTNTQADLSAGYYATDPVLSGQANAYEADLQLPGDLTSPLLQVGTMFAENIDIEPQYQYDDGQTPLLRIGLRPGIVIGSSPEYLPSSSGFPDSTKGSAALTPEAANSLSPLSHSLGLGVSPFAAVSDGDVYAFTDRLNPNLHASPRQNTASNFDAIERRAKEQRIIHGMSISASSQVYREDLRAFQAQQDGLRKSPTLQDMDNKNQAASQAPLINHPVIR